MSFPDPDGQFACQESTRSTAASPANPAATGAAGPAFEAKVGAACLTLLLTRGAPLFLGTGTLRSVHLQAGHLDHGWFTDDLLLEATNDAGESMKAALQVKLSFSLRTTSDSECVRTLHGALNDFRNSSQFDQRHDVVAVVTSSLSARLARGLRTLLDCARASISADDMVRRLALPDYLGKPTLEYFKKIRTILATAESGVPSEEELWRFLRCFHIADLDLNAENGITETMLRSLLSTTLNAPDPSAANATWTELVALALCDAGRAMSYTSDRLPRALLERHGKPTGFPRGVSLLLEDSKIVVGGISTTIAEKTTIPRLGLSGELHRLIEESPLVFVTGAAGSGKSALVKSAFDVVTQGSVGFAFRAASLAGNHINHVLRQFGLSLESLREQTALLGRKVLWVDSLEQLMEKPAEQRAAFLDLLRALRNDSSWRLVVTCRDYSSKTVRSAFFDALGLTPADLAVGELIDDELNDVALAFPPLEYPLGNPSLRKFLRNPFFLDKAARMNWQVGAPLPATERAFRKKVWKEVVQRVDEEVENGLPTLRGHVLVEVALRRSKALEPFIATDSLNQQALARLLRDSVLQSPSPGSNLYAPAHDVFEDWALMRWLDTEFERHGKNLASLLKEIGTYPALRRAYRRWLAESLDVDPEATDSMVVALVRNLDVAAHWREDTLVGVLQSKEARGFIERNKELLLADNAKMLRQAIHILRVACRAAIPRRMFGIDSAGEFFLPKGNGWIGVAKLLEDAVDLFTEDDLLMLIGFLEDWVLLTRYGLKYPEGAKSVTNLAWHWLGRIPWRSPVRNGKDRLLRILLALPLAAEPGLSEAVASAIAGEEGAPNETILKLIFNHFACDAVVRDLPDLAFRVAEHLLGLDRPLEKAIARNPYDHGIREVEHAFGFGMRHSFDDYPASAFHGPYLRMLWHHPSRGIEFIIRMINRAGDAYAHPENRCEHIEAPGTETIHLPDGPHEQHANWRLWAAYRGMQVAPSCFESALMALEYWLLEKVRREEENLETILMDLLGRSNNAAVSAVVASVAAANPALVGEAAFALLTCRFFLEADLNRSSGESLHSMQAGGLGLPSTSAESNLYEKEREEAARLEHRSRNLEHVAAMLQMSEEFRDRVWTLIDNYKKELPPESEQNQDTIIWRLQLHRMDTRNFVETGRTDDGQIIIGAKEPEPDLQALVEEQEPRSAALDSGISLQNWGMAAFCGRITSDDWQEWLDKAQCLALTQIRNEGGRNPLDGAPAYVAAVCIRDHWTEMSPEQQEWCAQTICDAVDADADATDDLAIVARNPTEGSRAGAFAISALFDKEFPPAIQARILPTFSRAVLHAVKETTSYAMEGVAQFLWKTDRQLALTSLQALVSQALALHDFVEKQQQLPYLERCSEDSIKNEIRSKMRKFVIKRQPGNEVQIASLDLARWPGRSIAPHVFTIATHNPNDSFIRQMMRHCAEDLPRIWVASDRRTSVASGNESEPFDPEIEHIFTTALCRFVIQLEPNDASEFLSPVFAAASRFPEQAANVVTWLALSQGDQTPAPTLWHLWQHFADDFSENADTEKIDEEHSGQAKMIQELFLSGNWAEQRDWPPLHGETQRLRAFFLRLPPTKQGFACYTYYLARVGAPTLPDALTDLETKLAESNNPRILEKTAVFWLEEILTHLIYGGKRRIRSECALRNATLAILDALVEAGSSPAYKLRDDFLTPIPN